MRPCSILFGFLIVLGISTLSAQISPDCDTAIPICSNTPVNGGTLGYGIDDYNGATTSGCISQAGGTIEVNSAWYRFRTGASGQLGFNISTDSAEDWDFALYRTNDCNNLGDPVRCNFFENDDNFSFIGVGEDPTGVDNYQYEDWLQVMPGEEYYLMINNYSNTNSGFSIQFSGNIFVTNPYDALDCSIISNLLGPPVAVCENENVVLDATTPNATSYDWYVDTGSGFVPISGQHDPTLQVTSSGLYRVTVIANGIPEFSDVQVAFTPNPYTGSVSDETSCSDLGTFDLSQKDNEALGSQNSNQIIVTYHSSAADAVNGVNPLPKQFSVLAGSETIYIRTSSLENPRCYDASESFQLTVVDSPVFSFPTEIFLCEGSSAVTIGETSPNPNYSYLWDSGETISTIDVDQSGIYTLTMTNNQLGESCSITQPITVVVSETPQISEVIIDDLSDNNSVTILTNVQGEFEYQLDGGAYQDSNSFTDVAPGMHTVTINDKRGCGSVTETITVVGFPKFFTPNGDGANDLWQIEGMGTLEDPIVHVYDRFGKLLKQLNANSTGWDGTYNGRHLPSSDYWFKLTYLDVQGQRVEAKHIANHFSLRR